MNSSTRFALCLSTTLLALTGCSKSTAEPVYADSGHGGAGQPKAAAESGAPMATKADGYGRAPAGAVDDADMAMAEEVERPGLGTSYGEHHYSEVGETSFERRRPRRPDRVLSLRYNDYDGVRAAAHRHSTEPYWGEASQSVAGFTVRVIDESGNTLPGGQVAGDTFALGHPGERYMLAIENSTPERVEVVASVDGLDVIDGSDASFRNRGYVVPPWTSVQIDGWRTSQSSVAAFRFSSVADSYAARTGRGRDVGVIGFAFFSEVERWEPPRQQYAPPPPPQYDPQRDRANPFPGR
jgi:hypothetical protein